MALTLEDKLYYNEHISKLLQHEVVHQMLQYNQHGDTNCLEHCLAVAYLSYTLSKKLGLNIDTESLIRGALLHDFFLYDWHDKATHKRFHGFRHPSIALLNAKTYFDLNKIECDIIAHHMWPLTPIPPQCKEAYIVTFADKYCSIKETIKRPSIRRFMAKWF